MFLVFSSSTFILTLPPLHRWGIFQYVTERVNSCARYDKNGNNNNNNNVIFNVFFSYLKGKIKFFLKMNKRYLVVILTSHRIFLS